VLNQIKFNSKNSIHAEILIPLKFIYSIHHELVKKESYTVSQTFVVVYVLSSGLYWHLDYHNVIIELSVAIACINVLQILQHEWRLSLLAKFFQNFFSGNLYPSYFSYLKYLTYLIPTCCIAQSYLFEKELINKKYYSNYVFKECEKSVPVSDCGRYEWLMFIDLCLSVRLLTLTTDSNPWLNSEIWIYIWLTIGFYLFKYMPIGYFCYI
jgi:hypothetical protein